MAELYERITAEEIAQINKALEASEGSFQAAADILGCTRNRIAHAVERQPALTARWRSDKALVDGKTAIDSITTVNRVKPKPLELAPQQRLAIELSINEKKMNKSLAKLGFKAAEVQAISSIEEFAGQHFEETLSIMHGGLLKSAMRLMLMAERIERDYLQGDIEDPKERGFWWDTYFEILEKLRSMNEQTNKAALTKALIEIKKKGTSGLGRPGFSPIAIQINAPSSSIKTEGSTG